MEIQKLLWIKTYFFAQDKREPLGMEVKEGISDTETASERPRDIEWMNEWMNQRMNRK